MIKLNLFIPGEPRPKQSARFRQIKTKSGKTFTHSYQTAEVKNEERSIKMIIYEQLPKDFVLHKGPIVIVSLEYLFVPPKSLRVWEKNLLSQGYVLPKITKPDLTDNLNKGLFDALEGIVFANDSQVCQLDDVKKGYSNLPSTKINMNLYGSVREAIGEKTLETIFNEPINKICQTNLF